MSVLTGLMGAGKTWFLKRLFNLTPPTHYTSTGVTEQSCRGLFHHTGTMSSNSLDLFSHSDVLEILANRFRHLLPPLAVVPPHPTEHALSTSVTLPSSPTISTTSNSPTGATQHSPIAASPSHHKSHPTSTTLSVSDSFTHSTLPPPPTSLIPTPPTSFPHSTTTSTTPPLPTSTPPLPTSTKSVSTTTHLTPTTILTSPTTAPSLNPQSPTTSTATNQSITSLVKKVPKPFYSLAILQLVHMIDTGGQPEFMESMPSLVHNCHLAVLVLNLVYGLDDYPSIDYHEEGKRYKRALPSQYSTRQIIQKLASTLQAKRFSQQAGQCFKLLVVATHRDRVPWWRRKRKVVEFDQAVSDILLPACEKELIRFSSSQILFDLNLKKPGPEDLEKLALIREKVGESGVGEVVQTPGSFLIFEQELVEFSETKICRSILSLDECLEIGAKLKMNLEMVRAALIFFHRQITFLYFRDVLPDLVFTKPQVPLDCINAIVQFSYKVGSGELRGVSEELTTYLRDAVITEEILSHKLLSKCFIPDLYEPRHAIDLLCHTFTLAPLSRDSQTTPDSGSAAVETTPSPPINREKREYLMMSLRPAIPTKDTPQHLPPPSEIAPLVVQFTHNCVPLSCFSRTISCLLVMYNWKLSRAKDGSPQCLAHNVVSLFKPQMPGQIVLVDTGHSFQVHIAPGRDTDRNDMSKICFQVKETIFTAIKQVFDCLHLAGIEASPAFSCPCNTKPLSHSASPSLFNSKWFFQCSITGESVGAADDCHLMWLEAPAAETEKPSLPKLLTLNILETVGTKYRTFGTFILNDETGSLVDAIEHDCLGQTHRITLRILQEWLAGKGEPPTWDTLTTTLRKCKLNILATKIEKEYFRR